ncbi:LysM peptidoglycan-binding domain-containing protein [Thomasclavelia cocleata]|uniref:LysM peptidoglycan-binding domain-containing protein n=1 Tax=Thomasclavelia cocleata TaxID=69824 RepID=UPI002430BD38|nr:LysM peptidoglycan-binding domain-containing protein [Thomasclavelia cocleata]
MQKIYFEKWVDLNHQLKDLLSLSVDESINYKIESVGVRAIGSLIVKGEYNEGKNFEENIEMDVLATFDKIVDQRDFNIKVEDFDYFIKDGNVQIKIEVGIHGVVEGEDRYVRDDSFANEDTLEEIENLIREDKPVETKTVTPVMEVVRETEVIEESKPIVEVKPVKKPEAVKRVEVVEKPHPVYQDVVVENSAMFVPEVKAKEGTVDKIVSSKETAVTKEAMVAKEAAVAEEISEQLQEKVYQSKSRPIFQDTSDSVGTYYLYIVKENDSYGDVATRYSVDENIIRDYNQDKVLEPGSVLIIPYVCK